MAHKAKKRPTIAFFCNSLEVDYVQAICRGIFHAAKANDVNLVVLAGDAIEYELRYNYNVIYEFVTRHNVDAILVLSSTLDVYTSKAKFRAFMLRYQTIPLVSMGLPIDGLSSVVVNGHTGLKSMIDHLIQVHHRRKIAFIKGPEGHDEAKDRLLAYQGALKENGIAYDPNLVIPGDFSYESAQEAMRLLLDQSNIAFDAVIAANDLMAFAVLDVLNERNILVPDQIAVAGFDNAVEAKYSNPSLTTVEQPIYAYTQKAMDMAIELIQKHHTIDAVLDTKVVIRESCGCLSETLQWFNTNDLSPVLEAHSKRHLDLEGLINLFMDDNQVVSDDEIDMDLLRPFILNCFRLFLNQGWQEEDAEKVLRSFRVLIHIPDLSGNQVLCIQKLFTNLQKWIEFLSKKEDALIGHFFQSIRVLISDTMLKMHGIQINAHHQSIRQLRELLMAMISMTHNHTELLQSVIPRLRDMGISNCYVYLYDQPIVNVFGKKWVQPQMTNLVMAYNDEGWVLPKSGYQIPWDNVLDHEWMPKDKRYAMMLYPLFVENEHLGLILLELNSQDLYLFEALIIEISCALKLSLLIQERQQMNNQLQEAVTALESYNDKLMYITQIDELTGLYNRRGFIDLAKQRLKHVRAQNEQGILIFADMDGLKKINDQYGHHEGDLAIQAMGDILVKTFRSNDIICRLGGDEFTIFTVGIAVDALSMIKERLQRFIDRHNEQAGKPYDIAISMGAVAVDCTEDVSLEELISRADDLLYNQKREKKLKHSKVKC